MNLRDSMLAAGEDAPLATSDIDVDQIVRQGRRTTAIRRTSLGSAVAIAAAVAVAVTSVGAAAHHTPNTASPGRALVTVDASPSVVTSAAPVLQLTAADMTGARSSGTHKLSWLWLDYAHDRTALDALAANPCTLPAGATAGRNFAPAPEDTCQKINAKGISGWVRRWGYSPQVRPWTTSDTSELDIFFRQSNGHTGLFIVTNTVPPGTQPPVKGSSRIGAKFDMSNAEVAKWLPNLVQSVDHR